MISMKEIKKLIDLKSIVTLMLTITMCYAFLKKYIDNDQFIMITTMVFTFYFTKKNKEI